MQYKSYIVEEDIDVIKESLVLFYGENLGLQNDIKSLIKKRNKDSEILYFTQDELLQLIKLTNNETVKGINKNIYIEINNYIKSCVDFINYEIKGETEKYFQKFKNNSCFSYEKKIKMYLNSIRL